MGTFGLHERAGLVVGVTLLADVVADCIFKALRREAERALYWLPGVEDEEVMLVSGLLLITEAGSESERCTRGGQDVGPTGVETVTQVGLGCDHGVKLERCLVDGGACGGIDLDGCGVRGSSIVCRGDVIICVVCASVAGGGSILVRGVLRCFRHD